MENYICKIATLEEVAAMFDFYIERNENSTVEKTLELVEKQFNLK